MTAGGAVAGGTPRGANTAFLLDALFLPLIGVGSALWVVFTVAYASHRSDFMQDYVAAYALRHHLPLYGEPSEQLTRRLLGIQGQYNFHPPTNALLFLPLTFLPYSAAFIVWNVVGLVVLLLLLNMMFEETGLRRPVARTLGAAVLVWPPFVANAALGQVSLYIALGLLWSWRLLKRGDDVRAGLVLGAVSLIKLFPLLFLVFLVATRRWRAAAACVGVVLLGLGVTWLAVGTQTFAFYFQSAIPEDARIWTVYPVNASLYGALAMLSQPGQWASPVLSPRTAAAIVVVMCAAIVAVTTVLAAAGRTIGRADEQSYIAFCAAMLLVSPLTWSHMFLVLIWPAATLIRDSGALSRSLLAMAAVGYVLLSLPELTLAQGVVGHYLPRQVPWFIAVFVKLPTLGLLVLWLIFCVRGYSIPADARLCRDALS